MLAADGRLPYFTFATAGMMIEMMPILQITTLWLREVPYFAVYNAHFLAQSFEGKIRMHFIHE